jgi:hypothetical protein
VGDQIQAGLGGESMTLADQHCSTCAHFDGVVCHAFATLMVASGWCPRWVESFHRRTTNTPRAAGEILLAEEGDSC